MRQYRLHGIVSCCNTSAKGDCLHSANNESAKLILNESNPRAAFRLPSSNEFTSKHVANPISECDRILAIRKAETKIGKRNLVYYVSSKLIACLIKKCLAK